MRKHSAWVGPADMHSVGRYFGVEYLWATLRAFHLLCFSSRFDIVIRSAELEWRGVFLVEYSRRVQFTRAHHTQSSSMCLTAPGSMMNAAFPSLVMLCTYTRLQPLTLKHLFTLCLQPCCFHTRYVFETEAVLSALCWQLYSRLSSNRSQPLDLLLSRAISRSILCLSSRSCLFSSST